MTQPGWWTSYGAAERRHKSLVDYGACFGMHPHRNEDIRSHDHNLHDPPHRTHQARVLMAC